MKQGKTLAELAAEVERQEGSRRDFVADTRLVKMETGEAQDEGAAPLVLTWGNGNPTTMQLSDTAHGQIADRLKVPKKFYDRLRADHPDILAATVTPLMNREHSQRMIRTLDYNDGRGPIVRAYLSNRYRPIDNFETLRTILPILTKSGIKVLSSEVTEKKLYLKWIFPDVRVDAPDLMPRSYLDANHRDNVTNGLVRSGAYAGMKASEIVAGGRLTNSEVGEGARSIAVLNLQCWCLNGAVRETVSRVTHMGRANEVGFDATEHYRDSTRALDDAALAAKTADTIAALASPDVLAQYVEKARNAKSDRIEDPAIIPQVIEMVSKRYALPERCQRGILASLLEDGDLTRYGIANAITAASQREQSYDLASQMEADGAKVIELGANDWQSIVAAAEKAVA